MTEIKEIFEEVPCGLCVTTQYWDGNTLVRQDVEIRVKEGLFAAGESGKLGE